MERYGHRVDVDGTEENADENDESDSVGGAESSDPSPGDKQKKKRWYYWTKKSTVCSVRYKRS